MGGLVEEEGQQEMGCVWEEEGLITSKLKRVLARKRRLNKWQPVIKGYHLPEHF